MVFSKRLCIRIPEDLYYQIVTLPSVSSGRFSISDIVRVSLSFYLNKRRSK